jgi:hypothetical protein
VTPPNSNYGSVYQVVATAGGLTSTIADQVFVS